MIVPNDFPVFLHLQQPPVDGGHIIRYGNPGPFRIEILGKRFRQLLKAQILMVVELQLTVYGNHGMHVHIPEGYARPPVIRIPAAVYHGNFRPASRHGVIISKKGLGGCNPCFPVQGGYLILYPVMHIYRAFMDFPEGLHFVHLRNFPAVFLIYQLIPGLVDIAQAEIPCRERSARPGELSVPAVHFLYLQQNRYGLPQIRKQGDVVQCQRHFRSGRPDMGQLDEQIVLIHNRRFTLSSEQPVRIHGYILIKGEVLKNQIVHAPLSVSPRPSCLLPEGGPGTGIAHQYRGFDLSDINPQLQRIGGYQACQSSGYHFIFDFLPFIGRIAAPVAGYFILPAHSGKAFRFQDIRGLLQNNFHVPPGFGEGDKASFRLHQLRDQMGRHLRGGNLSVIFSILSLNSRRLEEYISSWPGR